MVPGLGSLRGEAHAHAASLTFPEGPGLQVAREVGHSLGPPKDRTQQNQGAEGARDHSAGEATELAPARGSWAVPFLGRCEHFSMSLVCEQLSWLSQGLLCALNSGTEQHGCPGPGRVDPFSTPLGAVTQ